VGNPARSVGCVCRCGEPLAKWAEMAEVEIVSVECLACGLAYEISGRQVSEAVKSAPVLMAG